ncbi:DNA primase [candidate division WWE3 bacterium RIFCSPLOWO2_01_FULL_39_13]|uniref:DNA primase n=1 Tax=candidate division WWE3 bacterium RIFCSPLOWO2_01_FULL_39_13 TaxID=1802624 RepID=A0A1F4V3Y4_UNCKA|nr:MAG: DNA primase [candidate division WWE3 bacterium RIFCSPLOWO2_01_FULL_39_13]
MDNISAVREKVNIIELINSYVPLKKAGKNYRANCPFHKEKTPSFMVSQDLQRYRCFGCGKSGDIFTFVMEFEGIDFSDALKMLAERAGVTLKFEGGKSKVERDQNKRIVEINKTAARFYAFLLVNHKFGEKARKYLKERGIKSSTIKEFQIGYAPNSWDSLSKHLIKKGYSPKDIVDAGLGKFRTGNKDTYDMFRRRLMFPLLDHMGKIIGFAGRALAKDQEPKYINTPETAIFHKERFLFGLDKAKSYIRQKNEVVIVEGEFDMITPFQAGFKNIAASKGTALTLGQAALVKRYANTAILVFDNDPAGVEASIRGTGILLNAELDLKVASIPAPFKDPDDLAKSDPVKFGEVLQKALPIWDYYFAYASKKYNLSDVFERKKASAFLLEIIKGIENGIVRSTYVKKFSTLFDVPEETVLAMLEKSLQKGSYFEFKRDETSVDPVIIKDGLSEYPGSEIYLLALFAMADKASLKKYLSETPEDYFTNEETRQVLEAMKSEAKAKTFNARSFYDKLTNYKKTSHDLFEKVYLLDLDERLHDPDAFDREIRTAVNRLKKGFLVRMLKDISKAIKKAETVSDSKLIEKLQKEVKKHTADLALAE